MWKARLGFISRAAKKMDELKELLNQLHREVRDLRDQPAPRFGRGGPRRTTCHGSGDMVEVMLGDGINFAGIVWRQVIFWRPASLV